MLLISKKKALELLRIAGHEMPGELHVQHAAFVNWRMKTKTDIATIFGSGSPEERDFAAISFVTNRLSAIQNQDVEEFRRAYGHGMDNTGALLRGLTDRVRNAPSPTLTMFVEFWKRFAVWFKDKVAPSVIIRLAVLFIGTLVAAFMAHSCSTAKQPSPDAQRGLTTGHDPEPFSRRRTGRFWHLSHASTKGTAS